MSGLRATDPPILVTALAKMFEDIFLLDAQVKVA